MFDPMGRCVRHDGQCSICTEYINHRAFDFGSADHQEAMRAQENSGGEQARAEAAKRRVMDAQELDRARREVREQSESSRTYGTNCARFTPVGGA